MGQSHFSKKEMKHMYQKPCTDHLGNTFPTNLAMCKHYNITKNTFDTRIRKGWSLKDALTKPIQKKNESCTDHLGNTFPSVTTMCEHYHITQRVFYNRIEKGWSVKATRPTPVQKTNNS